ncbi:hypothetical protein PLESTF_000340100 [Pleodorina starrii]|nr:hypothetical protein PLESTM_001573700 [Pleodorina starrii]GLC65788.1 hypothetical protein PLESTF_000340100 [Pleodorina starrii]
MDPKRTASGLPAVAGGLQRRPAQQRSILDSLRFSNDVLLESGPHNNKAPSQGAADSAGLAKGAGRIGRGNDDSGRVTDRAAIGALHFAPLMKSAKIPAGGTALKAFGASPRPGTARPVAFGSSTATAVARPSSLTRHERFSSVASPRPAADTQPAFGSSTATAVARPSSASRHERFRSVASPRLGTKPALGSSTATATARPSSVTRHERFSSVDSQALRLSSWGTGSSSKPYTTSLLPSPNTRRPEVPIPMLTASSRPSTAHEMRRVNVWLWQADPASAQPPPSLWLPETDDTSAVPPAQEALLQEEYSTFGGDIIAAGGGGAGRDHSSARGELGRRLIKRSVSSCSISSDGSVATIKSAILPPAGRLMPQPPAAEAGSTFRQRRQAWV